MDPADFKFGMVPPGSPAADLLPAADDAARRELYDLARRRAQHGGLTPAEEERYQSLLTALPRP